MGDDQPSSNLPTTPGPGSVTRACQWTCNHGSHARGPIYNLPSDIACFGKCGTPAPWLHEPPPTP